MMCATFYSSLILTILPQNIVYANYSLQRLFVFLNLQGLKPSLVINCCFTMWTKYVKPQLRALLLYVGYCVIHTCWGISRNGALSSAVSTPTKYCSSLLPYFINKIIFSALVIARMKCHLTMCITVLTCTTINR